jgi:hypothetical protein
MRATYGRLAISVSPKLGTGPRKVNLSHRYYWRQKIVITKIASSLAA